MCTMRAPLPLVLAAMVAAACSSTSTGPGVVSVTVAPATDTLFTGQFVGLQATPRDAAGQPVTGQTGTWRSSDTVKATVSGTGVVSARDSGDVTVTVTVDGVDGQAHIHVRLLPVGTVTISPHLDSLAAGQSVGFTIVVKDTSGNSVLLNRHVTWSSSDTVVATVNASGLATVHDTGTTIIRALVEGKSDSALLVGTSPPAHVTLTPAGDTLGVGDTITLKAIAVSGTSDTLNVPVTYGSSNTVVATVSASGLVTAVGTGTTTITASAGGGADSVQFLVASCTTSVSLNPNSWAFPLRAGGIGPLSGVTDEVLFKTVGVAFATAPFYGTDSTHFVMGYNPGSGATDFAAGRVCTLSASPLHTYAKLRTTATLIAGLATTEEVFASNASSSTDFVLVRYTFTNTTTSPVTNFHAGLLADWDLNWDGNAVDDNVRWNSALGIEEAVESDTAAHPQIMGIVPLAATGGVTAHAWTNGQDPVHGGLFAFLTARDTTVVGPNDIRGLMGRGSVTIPAGGKYVVVFALVGGSNRAAFNANVTSAQTAAAGLY